VLGAFHSKLRALDDQTERYLAALRNPAVHVLAHPRGRRFNVRLGLHADWPRVFEEAAGLHKALEIDAYPDRQDLDVELLSLARESGVWISIGTDAHSTAELMFMEFGLAAAIRAGIPQERILNFMSREDLLEWASRVRAG
jgi:DNA polymerase (family 10)